MSTWRALTLPMIPGVPEAMEATSQAAGAMGAVLDALAGLINMLSDLVSAFSDPLQAALASLIAAIQALIDEIQALLAAGVCFYLDKGPCFTGGPPDGLGGFLSRWAASFEDAGDSARPQFSAGTPVSALLVVVGAETLAQFRDVLRPLASLFGIPSLVLPENDEPAPDLAAAQEQSLSTPPDWSSVQLGEVLPPMTALTDALRFAIGAIQVPESYAQMLQGLASIIADKAAALNELSATIQQAADDLNAIIQSEGLYILYVEGNSIPDLIEAAAGAGDAPPWSVETWVAGVCFLGATAEFGPVVELLGG